MGSFLTLVTLHAVVFLAAVLFNVILLGMLLYGTAVAMIALRDPGHLASLTLTEPSIGLALLCFLLILTIVTRSAVIALARRRRRRRLRS